MDPRVAELMKKLGGTLKPAVLVKPLEVEEPLYEEKALEGEVYLDVEVRKMGGEARYEGILQRAKIEKERSGLRFDEDAGKYVVKGVWMEWVKEQAGL